MKIGFYIHHTTISAGGIFTYSIGILKELLKSNEIEKVIIVTSDQVNERLKKSLSDPRLEIVNINRSDADYKLKMLLYFLLLSLSIIVNKIIPSKKIIKWFISLIDKINPYTKILTDHNVSLFHVPVQYSPVYGINIPVLITMHDLQEYHYPEFFSIKEKLHRKINNELAINYSDQIIVSFNHVKEDIIKYFHINEEKISVCPPPFAENWFLTSNESSWEELSKKFGLKKNYILYPAATWRHKNHITLVQVLKKLRDQDINISLVCTGNKTGHFYNIQALIDELNLKEEIKFLGIVSEQDLIGLYKNSSLVVIPTLYEAGSGPLYEAMRYGIPVVCSNVTSLPETMGNSEFLFNPKNPEEMLSKIKSGLSDEAFLRKNVQNSMARMNELNKKNYSECFYNSYQKVIS